ncbi:hypothetical protein ACP70R_003797 [Stipagrostis hirtigluma subsp. patula]
MAQLNVTRVAHLFDGLPQTSSAKILAMSGGEDRISALPDGVLQHVLGFLPAKGAVQTCVLARRWRYLWRSMRRLRISIDERRVGAEAVNKFVSGLLLLRDPDQALDVVEFTDDDDPERLNFPFQKEATYMNIWIRHVLLCQAKELAIYLVSAVIRLGGPPLVSRHLQRLDLLSVQLDSNLLDFASCPALEVLKIRSCNIYSERISSQSLKHLLIERASFDCAVRTRISVPSLIWLQLDFYGKAPLVETIPSLQNALVKPAYFGLEDHCCKGDSGECCGVCADCCGNDDCAGGCVLLGGLSSAMNLELIADKGMIIFRRDLRWCPTFSKLKKLLLNEWCVAIDLRALACILEHSPVLEVLTLQLCKGPEYTIETEGDYNPLEKSAAISEHLNIVKVNCEVVDERVCMILKFLRRLDIKFTIKRTKKEFQKICNA